MADPGYGRYIASAAENERNRRFQGEQNYAQRDLQKHMFGEELDFKKEQYGNLWDIQKANYDAEQNILNKFMVNTEKRQDYEKRLEDIKEVQDIGLGDVMFGDKTGEEWGTGMRQRWGQRLNPWAKTDEELAGEPEYDDITADDVKGISKENLMQLIQYQMMQNPDSMSNQGLLQLIGMPK